MARKKSTEAAPETESQEFAPTETTNEHGRKLPGSKADAIRMAIAAGFDSPQAGSGYIKSQFGMEVTPQHFSATRAQMKKSAETKKENRSGEPAKRGRKAKSQAVEGFLAPPEPKPLKRLTRQAELEQVVKDIQPAVGGSVFSDLAAIKSMVERLGVDEVKSIAELFG